MNLFLLENRYEKPREGQLKARFSDLYYGKLYIKCYYFYQQCKNHFDIAGTTQLDRTSFAASFLCERISFRQHQYKCRGQVRSLPLIDFKAFLQRNLGDSQAFVDTTWSRVKCDSQFQQEEMQDWVSHLKYLQSIL